MNNRQYVRTDLASECPELESGKGLCGIKLTEDTQKNVKLTTVDVLNEDGQKLIGKPIGRYVTLEFEKVHMLDQDDTDDITEALLEVIKDMTQEILQNIISPTVLVIGLGNRYITPDAVGPLTVKDVTVTRHIEQMDEKLFKSIKMHSVSAIAPGVSGQTGIETFDTVKSAVNTVNPDIIIAIDAIASRNADRLARTIQISNSGITPGSGIGSNNKAINKDTLGVPVIAIGIPTLVSSATLVYDALEKAGIQNIDTDLEKILQNGTSFYVTPNDCDLVTSTLSKLVSNSLNLFFSA